MSFELSLGGAFITALTLYPALELKKRRKWNPLMGFLMLVAGIGTVGIALWIAGLVSDLTSQLVVGAVALVLLAGFIVGVAADLLPDKRVDYPWRLFALPPLLAIVCMTGSAAFDYAKQQFGRNIDVLSQISV